MMGCLKMNMNRKENSYYDLGVISFSKLEELYFESNYSVDELHEFYYTFSKTDDTFILNSSRKDLSIKFK